MAARRKNAGRKASGTKQPRRKRARATGGGATSRRGARKTATPAESRDGADPQGLAIRLPGDRVLPLRQTRELQALAMRWAYKIRHRLRWAPTDLARAEQAADALHELEEVVGLTANDLGAIVDAGVAEIHIPHITPGDGWELRVFPWESMLAMAATALGRTQRFLVVRHLDCGHEPPGARKDAPALVVSSAPGELEGQYLFESEVELIEAALGAGVERRRNPTLAELEEAAKQLRPRFVHFTGIDAHEGSSLLGTGREERHDGVYLRDGATGGHAVRAEMLAAAIAAGSPAPQLFTCNTFHSGARTAALAVAAGCGAAIGFQDTIDDTLAELFFVTFYRIVGAAPSRLLEAFHLALREIQEHPTEMSGSCVILWSSTSLLRDQPVNERFGPEAAARRLGPVGTAGLAGAGRARSTGSGGREDLVVEVKPLDELNYSLLHNGQPVFKEFRLANKGSEAIRDVEVDVTLRVGLYEVQTRRTFHLDRATDDFGKHLTLPLTWDVERYRESVLTNLAWTITLHDQVVRRDSAQVRLLPIDVWRDDSRDWAWLPSFVLPRDPEVIRIIDRAQCYLIALSDDRNAGFDGYQSGDPDYVDLQVRALWSALVLDFELHYVEPPPTYAKRSQRLRSPSAVISDKRGTCIDLALLFCSCLEYVGLGTAVFLLDGHCFPAYWRSARGPGELARARCSLGGPPAAENGAPEQPESAAAFGADPDDEPWVYRRCSDRDAGTPSTSDAHLATLFDRALFGPHDHTVWEITSDGTATAPQTRTRYGPLLREDLVPVETVLLTEQAGLGEAIEAGWRDLEDRSRIDALIDVPAARGQLGPLGGDTARRGPRRVVTPLPLAGVVR